RGGLRPGDDLVPGGPHDRAAPGHDQWPAGDTVGLRRHRRTPAHAGLRRPVPPAEKTAEDVDRCLARVVTMVIDGQSRHRLMGPGRVRTGTGYEPDPGAVPTRVHRA